MSEQNTQEDRTDIEATNFDRAVDELVDAGLAKVGYSPSAKMRAEIEKRFTYHAPQPDQIPRYTELRAQAKGLALLILESVPPSREQSEALTCLETAIMFANAGIAREPRSQFSDGNNFPTLAAPTTPAAAEGPSGLLETSRPTVPDLEISRR